MPCPCGSGKKYKKCCLQKTEDLRRANELRRKEAAEKATVLVDAVWAQDREKLEEALADSYNGNAVDELLAIDLKQFIETEADADDVWDGVYEEIYAQHGEGIDDDTAWDLVFQWPRCPFDPEWVLQRVLLEGKEFGKDAVAVVSDCLAALS
jgi:hypothetical protein